jgi:hypothetical protein
MGIKVAARESANSGSAQLPGADECVGQGLWNRRQADRSYRKWGMWLLLPVRAGEGLTGGKRLVFIPALLLLGGTFLGKSPHTVPSVLCERRAWVRAAPTEWLYKGYTRWHGKLGEACQRASLLWDSGAFHREHVLWFPQPYTVLVPDLLDKKHDPLHHTPRLGLEESCFQEASAKLEVQQSAEYEGPL